MKRFFFAAWLPLLLGSSIASAKTETIYRQPNNPANFVKLEQISERKAAELKLNHPHVFTEDQMADMLRSLRYSRRSLFSDKEKIRQVFEEEYIEKFTPHLVKAFQEADNHEVVLFSVAQARPLVIIRNDRLTTVQMWVTGQELHIEFVKTEAKLEGDYKANTPEGQRLRENAETLRVALEPQKNQKFAFDSSKEIILDLDTNWEAIVAQIEADEERLKQEEEIKKAKGYKKKKLSEQLDAKDNASKVSAKDQKSAETRLSELKKLKDKGLISEQDYEKKKEEILSNL